jgi:protein FRG1
LHAEEDGGVVRSDSETIGFYEIFRIYCQVELKKERLKHDRVKKQRAHEEEEEHASSEVEKDLQKTYQSWAAHHEIVVKSDLQHLKQAKKEGRLREAMLDRRTKLKSDRFCK